MNNAKLAPHPHNQRKIKYVDHVLQKWLLVALVVLELLVLSAAGAILYFRLNGIVEDSLYRIHFGGQPSMFSILLTESLRIVAGLIAVNLLALFVADRIWARYVRHILEMLRELLTRTRQLDFLTDASTNQRHKVIALALDWRQAERARQQALRQGLAQLSQPSCANNDALRAGLLALRAQLPQSN